jgi:hypothetical protein
VLLARESPPLGDRLSGGVDECEVEAGDERLDSDEDVDDG